METVSRHLLLHGSIVLLIALLFGAPYAKAIKRSADAQVVNSWRVAHQSLTIGALLLLALAVIMDGLAVSSALKWVVAVSFIVSAYAFTVATPLAAITRDRGLKAGARGWAGLVYMGNVLGALTSLVGAALLVLVALLAL